MTSHSLRRPPTQALLTRLLEAPEAVATLQRLPPPDFSALVRRVGVEDAGELLALARTEQLVAAFDEDLFVNEAPGHRERLDGRRFATWLEVLLEAGDAVAAQRVSELSETFVAGALSQLLLVLDHDRLLEALGAGGRSARYADKALESALAEEIDGFLLVARVHDGWDAALSLVLALDRDHRDLLVRLLDRLAALSDDLVEDLDRLTTELSAEESLAEDLEGEREERRSRQGHVEPRGARAFLDLAAEPLPADRPKRDPLTRAYFRDLQPGPVSQAPAAPQPQAPALPGLVEVDNESHPLSPEVGSSANPDPLAELRASLARLVEEAPETAHQRLAELAYLGNVLAAGATLADRRLRPGEAAEAALLTVALGATLHALRSAAQDLFEVLLDTPADLLFRVASHRLQAGLLPGLGRGFLATRDELHSALQRTDDV